MKLNKIGGIILVLGFLVSLISILIAANCGDKSINDCLMEKEYLMPDFYWHTNTIKYVSTYGLLPEKVLFHRDGGSDGSSLDGEVKNVMHSPLYYYLGAGVFLLSKNIGLDPIFGLHLFSIILMLITNILFFILLKSILKNLIYRKQLIISSTALFVFLPINLYISLAIHNHALFYLFMILSFYMYNKFLENKNIKNSVFLGVSLGFTLLSSLMGIPLLISLFVLAIYDYLCKRIKKGNLLLTSLVIGSIVGSFTLIRNYLLFRDPIWGGIVGTLQNRSFYVIFRLIKSFIGGVYGGYESAYYFIIIVSAVVFIIGIYGIFNLKILKKKIYLILLMGVLTLVLSLHTLCNVPQILKGICFGDIIHGRYLLGAVPMLSVLFSLGLIKILKNKKRLIYLIIILICLVYVLDFIYAFTTQ